MPITGTYTVVTLLDEDIVEVRIDNTIFIRKDHLLIRDRANEKSRQQQLTPIIPKEKPERKRRVSGNEATVLFGPIVDDPIAKSVFEQKKTNIREYILRDLLEFLQTPKSFSAIRNFFKDRMQANDKYAYNLTKHYIFYLDSSNKIFEKRYPGDSEPHYETRS